MEAAHSFVYAQTARTRPTSDAARSLPAPARFREESGRGLLLRVWINGAGPFNFALDTGAGSNIISPRVAAEVGVRYTGGRAVPITGLSGAGGGAGREATVQRLAVGARENELPGRAPVLVTDALPPDLDGVLDPAESFYPLGFIVDMPAGTVSAFDPRVTPLRASAPPADGAIVAWLTEPGSRRPFVQLENGRRALLDTGSGFGLAVNAAVARAFGIGMEAGRERARVRDLGRGHVAARRVAPATVELGGLVLRRVPTDVLYGAATDAPVILGRDALRPFRLTFDPASRLIRIEPR
jgi:predicted aspartyl protease